MAEKANDIDKRGENEKRGKKSLPLFLKLANFALRVVGIFFLLILLVFLLFRFEAVQSWSARQLVNYISKDSSWDVEIDKMKINLSRHLVLEDVMVRDFNEDTLVHAKSLSLKIQNPLLSLANSRILGSELKITDGTFHVTRRAGEKLNNLQKLMGQNPYLPYDSTLAEKEKSHFYFQVDEIILQNFCYINEDQVVGKYESYCLDEGFVILEEINFTGPQIFASEIWINQPQIVLEMTPHDTVFADSLSELKAYAENSWADHERKGELPFFFRSRFTEMVGGRFKMKNLKNPRNDLPDWAVNWSDLDLTEVGVSVEDLAIHHWNFSGMVHNISFQTTKGLRVDSIKSSDVNVTSDSMILKSLIIKTDRTDLRTDLRFDYAGYPSFYDFAREVNMDLDINQSYLEIEDMLKFVPTLANSSFFNTNKQLRIGIAGQFLGDVNNLIGQDLRLNVGNQAYLEGNFDTRDLTVEDNQVLHFNLKELSSDIPTLREIIPGFSPPAQMDRLGDFSFKGSFDGYFKDFVALGSLTTEVGSAEMDMRMDLRNGAGQAAYSGSLSLIDFDMAAYTLDPDFGKLNLVTQVKRGRGLEIRDLHADLLANVTSFEFKGYTYENVMLNGAFDSSSYRGYFNISEENIDLQFDGTVLISEKQPQFNIDGQLNHIDLQALNISDKKIDMEATFNVNITDPRINSLQGNVKISNLMIDLDGSDLANIRQISAIAGLNRDSTKYFQLESPIAEAEFSGRYKLVEIHRTLMNLLYKQHNGLAKGLGITKTDTDIETDLAFDIKVMDSYNLELLLNENLGSIMDLHARGRIDEEKELYFIEVSLPEGNYKNQQYKQVYILADGQGPYSNIIVSVDETKIGEDLDIDPSTVFLDLRGDTADFTINTTNFETFLDQLNLEGSVFHDGQNWVIEFNETDLRLIEEQWFINPNNYLKLSKGYVETKNLNLFSGEKRFGIQTLEGSGMEIYLENILLENLNAINSSEKWRLKGLLEAQVTFPDMFQSKVLFGELKITDFQVNEDDYGELRLLSKKQNQSNEVVIDARLGRERENPMLAGGGKLILPEPGSGKDIFSDAHFDFDKFPLAFLEYFISKGITGTKGYFDGFMDINGSLKEPELNGEATIYDANTKIVLLGARYFVDGQTIRLTSQFIDLGGVVLRDKYGHKGTVTGGLIHNNFQDFELDTRIQSDKMMLLNTTEEDNSLYYGHCLGSIDARFSGSFSLPTIVVDAENKDSTEFFISVGDDINSSGLNYIEFLVDSAAIERSRKERIDRRPTGVEFTLNLNATPEAEIQIIFDKSTRDIIKGSGEGYITFNYNRTGNLSIYGGMSINQGEYTYTNQLAGRIGVNKPFRVRPGSTIEWTGDPYNANIDIKAVYSGLRAAPYNLILSSLPNEDTPIDQLAKEKTDVDLFLNLQGDLLKPDISFDIQFPNLTGQIKALTDSKISELRNNQGEMNLQAASLLTFRDFAPDNPGTSGGQMALGAVANTVSEWLSSQISYYLTEIFMQVFDDVGFIEDYQFDVGFVLPTGDYVQTGEWDPNKSEINFGNRIQFLDRRLEIDFGGNILQESTFTTGGYVTPYVSLEYILTKDRRWRIRAYSDSDFVPEGRKYEHGVGISFRREFDTLKEFMTFFKKDKKSKKQ